MRRIVVGMYLVGSLDSYVGIFAPNAAPDGLTPQIVSGTALLAVAALTALGRPKLWLCAWHRWSGSPRSRRSASSRRRWG